MARKKTLADEVYNVRRRLNRAAARAEKQGAPEVVVRDLRAQANYLKGKVTTEKLKTARSIYGAIQKGGTTPIQRRTAIYKQQLNAAGSPGSIYSATQRTAFFAFTKRIWTGEYDSEGNYIPGSENPKQRVETIMSFFYEGNTQQARDFRNWQKRTYKTERKDLNLLIEYVTNVANKDVMDSLTEEPSGGTPIVFQKAVWFG